MSALVITRDEAEKTRLYLKKFFGWRVLGVLAALIEKYHDNPTESVSAAIGYPGIYFGCFLGKWVESRDRYLNRVAHSMPNLTKPSKI